MLLLLLQIQEIRRRSGLDDMFVVCKFFFLFFFCVVSLNHAKFIKTYYFLLAEYWSGKYIIYSISCSSLASFFFWQNAVFFSIKLFLPYIRTFKEEVSISFFLSFFLLYIPQQKELNNSSFFFFFWLVFFERLHFLTCRCIWTSIEPVESGQDMTWELYLTTRLSRSGLTMQLPLLIITSVFFNLGIYFGSDRWISYYSTVSGSFWL